MIDKADKLFFADGIGKSILKKVHDFYIAQTSEDRDHIVNVKRIIEGIAEYLKGQRLPVEEIEKTAESLKQFAATLFVTAWLKNKKEGDDLEDVREESKIMFDYVYEEEEYL